MCATAAAPDPNVFDLRLRRQFYAEDIALLANLHTPGLVEALATVPRERFLPPGPWFIKSDADVAGPARRTPDADPRHVCHNVAVAIDRERQLFNGQPSFVAMLIDALGLTGGGRAVHIGAGTGYYTALLAHAVGQAGRVLAIEVDPALAARSRTNLETMPWVEVREGDGTGPIGEADAILVNAGVTHPLAGWLDALGPGGRIVLPLTTAGYPGMGPTIGKGLVVLVTRDAAFTARTLTFAAIYSAIGIRDPAMDARVGEAFKRNPFPRLTALRRDPHEPLRSCWLHGDGWCLTE